MPVYLLARHGCLGVQGVHTAGKERNSGYPWDTFYQSLIETKWSKKDRGVVICVLIATSKRQPEQHCVPTQSCVCAMLQSAAAAANVFFWECQPTPRQN